MHCPCHACDERTPECHDACVRYRERRKLKDEAKAKRREEWSAIQPLIDTQQRKRDRWMKKHKAQKLKY
ncbi:MAG: hypothetical protein IKS31_01455 [Clostridia bacterium]|nr:hypothetical protein [Clostridia bacterium]